MNTTELMLIDLSGIAHQAFHVSDKEPDPGFIARTIIARVRSLASAHPHAAICCDAGKSFRADIDPQYKANRDTENRAVILHQMDVACDTLRADGFPVWSAKGFEADDLIATATQAAMQIDGASVLIVSDDKDLLQLVTDRVHVHRLTSGIRIDPAGVVRKLKVQPTQVADYLALLGDKSDNILGAKGIGEKIASDLLTMYGTLAHIYNEVPLANLKPSVAASLTEFKDRWPTVAKLIALRTDAPIEFSEIASERTAPPMEDAEMAEPFKQGDDSNDATLPVEFQNEALAAMSGATEAASARISEKDFHAAGRANIAPSVPLPAVYAAPVDFSQQLEPRSMDEAVKLADRMFQSRLFGAYGTPQAVLATVLAGRELGLPAMASLRAFHIIEGKPTLSAGIIQSLVMKSKLATYFRCTERTAERATFATKRGDDPEVTLTFTVEEARRAFGFTPEMNDKARAEKEVSWAKSGWGRNPADNCVARASSKLARLVYPDVVSGLYAPEEMD